MKSLSELLPDNVTNEFNDFLEKEKLLIISLFLIFAAFLIFPFAYHGNFETALQIIILGAILSSLYAVLALGFSLIYGIAKMFKLSLGGYYVLGAYSMYFLLETVKISPSVSLLKDFDGVILISLVILPLILSLILFIFFWRTLNKKEFLLLVLAFIITVIGIFVWAGGIVESLYAGASTLLLSGTIWYLELSNRIVAIGTFLFGLSILIFSVLGLPTVYITLMIIAVLITASLAMLVDRYILDQVRSSHVNTMIVTFSMALILQSIIQIVSFPENGKIMSQFGPEDRSLMSIVPKASVNIFGALIDNIRIVSLLAAIIACILLYLFIWFSKMGTALRAVSQDEEAASLAGIDIRKMTAIVSGIGMGLIGFAAALTSSFSARPLWNPFMGWSVLIIAISVVTLGGMGSLPGSIIAAFIIGYIEVIVSSIPEYASFSVVIPFVVIILVLIFKPEGLLGTKKELEG
ncbi:MAG: branched-chain amino acid ABC transporter permease [Candidatus Heimdallarchaeota archaeon]